MNRTSVSALRLWQLISPTLPIGAYAWSTGLEYAVEERWVHDEASAQHWILGQIRHSFPQLDVPVFLRLYQAWHEHNFETVKYWNAHLLAMRESMELQQEDAALGAALLRVLPGLNLTTPDLKPARWSYAAVFAYACQQSGIDQHDAARGLVWSWCENQVAAAIKLVPLGQSSGQRMLTAALGEIENAVQRAQLCTDDDIGMVLPGLAMASALHETQYSRLFRS